MKTERRKDAKAVAQLDARLSARVSREAYQRLFVASVMNGSTAGEILDRLILEHCRDWALPAKISERPAKHDRVNSPIRVSDSAPEAALEAAA